MSGERIISSTYLLFKHYYVEQKRSLIEGRNRLKLSLIEGKSILLYENFYYHGYF